MSDVAIRVSNLGKQYKIGARRQRADTLRDALAGTVKRFVGQFGAGGRPGETNTIWALKDVSFEVKRGEVLGVIGRNGAGKSTLLKILSRITEPTTGEVDLHGRVGSLLEVGTGFHAELSGRENIYLNGAIIGMKRREIQRRFDEIVDFAGVEQFIDTPVKHYSSGMYMRLAFAVAAYMETEILMVDEVLAVGDAEFQKKCLGKMGEVARGGRTVLFVSHNMAAVRTLCSRVVLLETGRRTFSDIPEITIQYYLAHSGQNSMAGRWTDLETAPGNRKACLRAVEVEDLTGAAIEQVDIGEPWIIVITYEVFTTGTALNLSISLHNADDVYIFASPSIGDAEWFQKPHPVGKYTSRCVIPGRLLNQARYFVTVLLVENGLTPVEQLDKIVSVELVDLGQTRAGYYGYWGGVVRPTLDWTTERLSL